MRVPGAVEETRSVLRSTRDKGWNLVRLPKRSLLEAVNALLQTARGVLNPFFDAATIQQGQSLIHETPQRYFRKVEYPTLLIRSCCLFVGPSVARFRAGIGECPCWGGREKVRINNGRNTTRLQRYLCPQIT